MCSLVHKSNIHQQLSPRSPPPRGESGRRPKRAWWWSSGEDEAWFCGALNESSTHLNPWVWVDFFTTSQNDVFFSSYTMYKPYIPGHWGTSWYNMVLTHLLAEMQPYWSWPINPVDAKKLGDHGWIMGRNYRTSCEFLMFLMGASCSNTWSSLRLTHAMLACPRYLLSLKSPNMGYPKRRNWWYPLDFRGYKLPFFFGHGFPLTKEQRAKEKEAKMAKEWGLPKALQWRPLVAFLYGNPEKRCRKSQIQYLK